ncbi:MAG: hypothetical protein ABSH48_20710 [Verrucomicrobiota bacterium]|jgi:hypothetical protein
MIMAKYASPVRDRINLPLLMLIVNILNAAILGMAVGRQITAARQAGEEMLPLLLNWKSHNGVPAVLWNPQAQASPICRSIARCPAFATSSSIIQPGVDATKERLRRGWRSIGRQR